MTSYIVTLNSVRGLDQKENGNAINYSNKNLKSFRSYEEALTFARREQKNLRTVKRADDPSYDAIYVVQKSSLGEKAVRFFTRNDEKPI